MRNAFSSGVAGDLLMSTILEAGFQVLRLIFKLEERKSAYQSVVIVCIFIFCVLRYVPKLPDHTRIALCNSEIFTFPALI